ncbi:MAG TPA: hypothetical protein VNJ08_10445 [Bacteriovoracaceae bacterium]|nr:hypothetical protein [Bacteriovoracaceae bacterium]
MNLLWLITLIPSLSLAGLFSDDAQDIAPKLSKIASRILKAETKGEPINWSCEVDGTDICKKEVVKHYNLSRKEVEVPGSDLRKHLDELKGIKEKETSCLVNYEMAATKDEIQKLVSCLKDIKYEFSMPKDIRYFYLDPQRIFSSQNRDALVASLEDKVLAIEKRTQKDEISEKVEVENQPVSVAEFEKQQQLRKDAEKKYEKYPPVPSSQSLLSAKAGKRYRIFIQSDDTNNAKDNGKSFQFTYFILRDTGFIHSGYGHYALTCNSGNCLSTGAYWEEEVYKANDGVGTFKKQMVLRIKTFDAIVETTGKKMEGVNGLGQKMVFPVLRIIETY